MLLITQAFPKYPGDSTAPFMAAIVHALARRGHEIDVVIPHHPDFAYPDGDGFRFVEYHYSPLEQFSPWGFGGSLSGSSRVKLQAAFVLPVVAVSASRRISRLLADNRYGVVHAHWLLPNGWLASKPAAKRRVPLVVSLHGSDVGIAERKFFGPLARAAIAASAAVTAASDDLRCRAIALGANPTATWVVRYGVDTTVFAPRQAIPGERHALGASDGELLVVAVGRLLEVKGFRYIIEAVAGVRGVRLAVVGEGDLRSELEQLARDRQAPVTFVGNLDHRRMPDVLAAADIVVVPSVVGSAGNTDGLPNTLLESLSTGRPVIASRIGGIPEIVTDRENGLLTPEKDVHALASALVELRDDSDLRAKIGHEARRRTVAGLSWDATAAAFEEAYAAAADAAT